MQCPACGTPTLPNDSKRCLTCRATLSAPIWQKMKPASLRSRLFAALLDHALALFLANTLTAKLALLLTATTSAQQPPRLSPLYTLLLNSLFFFGYFVLTTWLCKATPGKWLTRLKVVDALSGDRLSFWKAFQREFTGRLLCLLLSPIGYATVVSKYARGQTIADIIASTVVLKPRRQPRSLSASPDLPLQQPQ